VVVTLPLGVLKRDVLRFRPALPPDRLMAIERLGFGRYEKVALRFDEPFCRAAGLPHAMIFPRDPGAPAVWVIGLDAFGAGPVLVFHSATSHVLGAAPDDAAQWVLDLLAEAIGSSCPAPAAVAMTSWANDPYSGGAYTHIPQEQTQPTLICWASRSAGDCYSPESTPKAPGWLTLTAR
jgi:polyamine oxidase